MKCRRHIPEIEDFPVEQEIEMNRNYIRDDDSHEGLDTQQSEQIGQGARWFIVYTLFVLAITLGVAFCSEAEAQTLPRNAAEISFTYATSNTDGTPIPTACSGAQPCGRIARTQVEYGTCNGTAFGSRVGDIFVTPPADRVVVSNLVVQTYCFRANHQTDQGANSAWSNVATKTIAAPQPNPPLIAIDATAYEIRRNSAGSLVAKRIGIVPMGTGCSGELQTVGSAAYARVPREAVDVVNWPQNLALPEIWAKCG